MTIIVKPQPNDEDGNFAGFLEVMRNHFTNSTKSNLPLFKLWIGEVNLFDLFINNLEEKYRQHYTCNCCRSFINRYGSLVTVDETGTMSSAIWNTNVPVAFRKSVQAILKALENGVISKTFISSDFVYGVLKTGLWTHMSVVPQSGKVYTGVVETASQVSAKKTENRRILEANLKEFSLEVLEKALVYIKTGGLYRGENYEEYCKWVISLKKDSKKGSIRDNWLWFHAATAPSGWCSIKNGMLGTLLESIEENETLDVLRAKWQDKMSQYMRAQVAPTAGNVNMANKIIEKMETSGSLARRFANLEEVQTIWQPFVVKNAAKEGVFSHLVTKAKPAKEVTEVNNITAVTWEKFQRTILPNAKKIEVLIPESSNQFMALVTAVNSEAPVLFQWGNHFSWYYHGGIDSEIQRRVVEAGGKYEGVDIRASLIWNNRDDLDLHVITPAKEHIYYGSKRSSCQGWLDVDMNVSGETDKPVENIRWEKGKAKKGRYKISVQNFTNRTHKPTPFRVEVEINGDLYHFDGIASPRGETHIDIPVFEFNYEPGKKLGLNNNSTSNNWNVTPKSWALVSGITYSPNMWDGNTDHRNGRHVFFLVENCKDTSQKKGRGFFCEALKGEFHPIRATLEAYAASQEIENQDNATACGIGLSEQNKEGKVTLKVTTDKSVATYTVDRWD